MIVVACEVGTYKPDPGIFRYALERLQVSPARSLYVGDSITHDTLGAKAAGLTTVLFSQTTARNHASADYSVQGIRELQALLNHLV
jgi:FMN phosphatase YigB (HAD superfamily)